MPMTMTGDGLANDVDPSPDGGYACRLFADGRFLLRLISNNHKKSPA